jgi:hypothetical protein
MSRVSSVVQRWTTGWMIGGSSPDRGWEFFSSPPRPYRLGGPLIQRVPRALSLRVKRPGREADYSAPSSKGKGKTVPVLQLSTTP